LKTVFFVNSLKHNLLSISQLCDKGYKIIFYNAYCMTLENDKVTHIGNRTGNVYKLRLMHAWE
jgi:hypothetical protein